MKRLIIDDNTTDFHRSQSLRRTFVALALTAVAASVVAITLVQGMAHDRRYEQSLLTRLHVSLALQSAAYWQAAAGRADAAGHKARPQSDTIPVLLDELAKTHLSGPDLARLSLLVSSYESLASGELTRLPSPSRSRYDQASETKIATAYNAAEAAIDGMNRQLGHEISLELAGSYAITVLIIVLCAFAMRILYLRIDSAQGTIGSLKTMQDALARNEQRFSALIRNSVDVILIVDEGAFITYASSPVTTIWGYDADAIEGMSIYSLLSGSEESRLGDLISTPPARDAIADPIEMRVKYANGTWAPTELIVTNLLDEPGIEGVVLTCRNITERKQLLDQLTFQSFHDPLTKLPNRTLFVDRLQQALFRGKRNSSDLCIIYLDLDNFKVINEGLGHTAGDMLLMTIANRLLACARPGDIVARLGGDEFTILMEDTNDTIIMGFAERVVAVLHTPIDINGQEIFTTASIGIAVSSRGESTPDDLLRDADTATYQAKTSGKAQTAIFDISMNARAVERMDIESNMRRAIENHEFTLHYQPIITLPDGQMHEVEALVRWNHPMRGLIPPLKFIPIAEETGMIVPLGRWILEEACRQTVAWHNSIINSPPIRVSVNLSARQVVEHDLVSDIAHILERTGLAPEYLKLEITETAMMADADRTITKLRQLRDLGLRIAVDDFGTGYSSMAYLSLLPVDTLKIDRSFVIKMLGSADDAAIVRTIVSLAKSLNLHVTCEGIETTDQLDHLVMLGCDYGQGYLFSKPVIAEMIATLAASDGYGEALKLAA
ncbi:MAG TPA: EAL domain-containing protein [Capsulimonadaceae bacterium]|jgi:diguanylate cyclase (GGDEF)-like protein/PAS domain S-box-containing protein